MPARTSIVVLLVIVSSVLWVTCGELGYPEARLTVHVTDELGDPVADAEVRVGYTTFKTSNPWDGRRGHRLSGVTAQDGSVAFSYRGLNGPFIRANKEGHYEGSAEYLFGYENPRRREPWNPTIEIRLRKIGNPIPMYAKAVSLLLPNADGAPVGYDLLVGDLVVPHGKGEKGDLVISLTRKNTGDGKTENTLVIEAVGNGNGFLPIPAEQGCPGSRFGIPRHAPDGEYGARLVLVQTMQGDRLLSNTVDPDAQSYFLRTQARDGAKAEGVGALYGALVGPVRLELLFLETGRLWFRYYLNPDGTRNIEFDPKRNLLKDLTPMERVGLPFWTPK